MLKPAILTDANPDPVLTGRFDELLREVAIAIEPISVKHAEIAREACRNFGKGRHRAGLDFGDCLAYALARETGEPSCSKGGTQPHRHLKRWRSDQNRLLYYSTVTDFARFRG